MWSVNRCPWTVFLYLKGCFENARYNLGVAYARKGRIDEAISEYKLALAIKPDYVKVHNKLAFAYYSKGNYKLAM